MATMSDSSKCDCMTCRKNEEMMAQEYKVTVTPTEVRKASVGDVFELCYEYTRGEPEDGLKTGDRFVVLEARKTDLGAMSCRVQFERTKEIMNEFYIWDDGGGSFQRVEPLHDDEIAKAQEFPSYDTLTMFLPCK